MTTEQAQQRLEEIRRLLMEKDKAEQIVKAIDLRIAHLAGHDNERKTTRRQLSKKEFLAMGAP